MNNKIKTGVVILASLLFTACAKAEIRLNLDSEIQKQGQRSQTLMLQNISRPDTLRGVVVASPSKKDPDYFFHWIRDSALTMEAVIQLYNSNQGDKNSLRQMLFDYATLSRRNQLTPNLSGGLGEPKFNTDGSAFNDPWGRPQSDGPALRAIALMHFARILLKEGYENSMDVTKTVIKADLQYVAKNWEKPCFDVWEETQGHHFYTMMVQRRALIEGAAIAIALDDGADAALYRHESLRIKNALEKFWDQKNEFINATQGQIPAGRKSGLDTAVILAALHGDAGDGFFSPGNDMILSTAMKLKNAFDSIYSINHNTNLATAIGRYPEDVYNGNGDSQGNPWFLTTLAYAELFGRVRQSFEKAGTIAVSDLNKPFLNFAAGENLQSGMMIKKDSPLFQKIIHGLGDRAKEFFARALHHAGPDGSVSEEINRDTGAMQGAQNLTWSHASFLTAEKSIGELN